MQAGSNRVETHDVTPEDKLYTYVIVRKDLEMSSGKMSSQVAHASRLSLLEFISHNPHRASEFLSCNSAGSVVVLQAKNQKCLEDIFTAAKAQGLPSALFVDSGHIMLPHFTGSPVVTALSIGPAARETMRSLTRKFQVVG